MKIKEKIVDLSTGEETLIERDETTEEKTAREKNEELRATEKTAEATKASEKAALLEKLGISEDEAKLLLG